MYGKRIILKGRLVTPNDVSSSGDVIAIEGDSISFIGGFDSRLAGSDNQVFDFESSYICPGFIDMHIHGYAGADVMDCTVESLDRVSWELAQRGTTSFLATTMSAPSAQLVRAIGNIRDTKQQGTRGAQLLGCHLEGPFLNPGKKGAQKAGFLRLPSTTELQDYLDAGRGCIRMITMAPELAGAFEVIKMAGQMGIIVSLGHSEASLPQVAEACEAGLGHVTHVFNAMDGLHHRDPGTTGAVLSMPSLSVDVIPDGFHVHPSVIKILIQSKGINRVSAISDCIRAGGLGDGEYELGGQRVLVKNGFANLADGTLAGSTITLSEGLKVLVEKVGLSLAEAVKMVSLNPARTLGLTDRGVLERGKRADIVVLDTHLNVLMTIIAGRIVYKA
ncbi:MAG: N-acetylglucosamine-6-phosphate deacetylase [Thermincola sp.]|nr:N-acetylglucosamine-6-phosphate deacetylase [Thermincola sp.]MDT3704151.1 N-acetylglucosamine-6-phosphate deacetylase [Thermincola sp.]